MRDTAAIVHEFDLTRPDGRTVHGYDSGGDGAVVLWQHGTPNVGAPPQPLKAPAAELGLRWVSLDRGGYGGSSPHPGRTVANAAADAIAVIDALGVDRFAGMGPTGAGALRAALADVDDRRRFEADNADAPIDFTARDWAALAGPWGWLGTVAAAGTAAGLDGLIDDDRAYVMPWGVDLSTITASTLISAGASGDPAELAESGRAAPRPLDGVAGPHG